MRLANEQYEKAKQTVADIIFDYNLKYPINIFDLIDRMGFAVVPYSNYGDNRKMLVNFSKDGFNQFIKSECKYFIYYNDDETYKTRINFTIAHEIGHIVLDCNDNSIESNALADFFAAYLLVPVVLIIDKKLTSVEEIMEYFGVGFNVSKNSLSRAVKRLTCNKTYTEYEKLIIQSQK